MMISAYIWVTHSFFFLSLFSPLCLHIKDEDTELYLPNINEPLGLELTKKTISEKCKRLFIRRF